MNALELTNELLSRFSLKEQTSFGLAGTDSYTGLRKINLAIQMICASHPFKWLHKTSVGTITAVTGTSTYTLTPTDLKALLIAKHTYQGGGWIKVVDRETLETYRPSRSDSSQRDVPSYMTLFGKVQSGTDWLWQAEVWPPPSSDFNGQTISFYYSLIPADLSATTDVPIVPKDFHWVICEVAETLWRRGPLRVGGDQNQLDLYAVADRNAKDGIRQMIAQDSVSGQDEMSWEVDRAPL